MDIKEFFSIQTDKVRRNSTIETQESVGQDFMIHIDNKTPKLFTPQMPRRAATSEDNTVPRVTVTDNLLGAIIGYSGFEHEFHNGSHGMYINVMDFEACIKPNNKLVYDSSESNEYWLVTYDKATAKYRPRTIGKVSITELIYKRGQDRKLPEMLVQACVEISEDIQIRMDPTRTVGKGYYEIVYNQQERHLDSLVEITLDEYRKRRELAAITLNHKDNPLYEQW